MQIKIRKFSVVHEEDDFSQSNEETDEPNSASKSDSHLNFVALPREIQKLHSRKKTTNRCKENSLLGIKSQNNSSDSDTNDKEFVEESHYQPSPSLSSTIKENKTLSESSSKSKQCGIIPDSLMCLSVIV